MKSVNIFDFFPLKDQESLERYLKKDDDYEERKRQFYQILIPCQDASDKKKFASAVLLAVFSHEYWMSHRWPTVQ